MGTITNYAITGALATTTVVIVVTYFVIFDVISGINEFQKDIEQELAQFKDFSNDAWETMMTAQQAEGGASRMTVFTARIRRGGSYSTGGGGGGGGGYATGGGGGGGGGGCQCAAQSTGCPRGPPGSLGLSESLFIPQLCILPGPPGQL
ncbi:unnamed protein product, partial [Nippostrongylus brasiliensis]|uniref:Col_cuticle_N domain-containing protein n=1 Tax=Nippostrongylus brasiliensis TaxID=27835 RepID=A0A0N4XSG4_NIPBR